ncbi:ATG C terminal domain-containing protein [Kickxella alabastrina]|uniref:ATG C terminal domain-containing protein n=1 Tax=Kickxella alabastrina TaxID=61397 RepID=UPI002220EBAC|nr:ATG C terminal domain-containing protein [Kickxella alabastrina]KAI7833742.1 ATG C terminal domain-containing protein [Kickxella alabastrina]
MPESRGPLGYRSSPLASPRSPRKQSRQPGRPARRSAKPKIELRATHVHAEYKQFSEDSATAYDLGLNVGMLEILDQLESSEWSKFLTRRRDAKTGLPSTLHSLATTRNRDLLTKGTSDSDRELRVDVEISPLRCYIHQDALDFLIAFFETSERHSAILANIKRAQEQAMTPERRASSVNHPYFQIVRIAPINVIFDYKPRRLRTAGTSLSSSRKPVELLNFFPLEDAEMTLNTVKVRGVAGMSKLIRELGSSWLPHLTQTQIPGVVSGMTPLRSLVNIGSGMADLVILPLEQYRKDGRLVQGIKRGAKSFARTTAMEAIQLGAKVAINAQTLLEQAGDILNVDVASGESSNPNSHDGRLDGTHSPHGADQQPHIVVDLADWPDYMSADGHGSLAGTEHSASIAGGSGGRRISFNKSKYARQPENLSEGMRQAYMRLRSNVGDAVQTILAIPVVVQESEADGYLDDNGVPGRSPVHGSVRAVVRAVPVAVLKPMIGATEAVSKTLLGLRNTMEPARRGQLEDKYKSRSLNAKKSYPS